jgi:hypothetical protein
MSGGALKRLSRVFGAGGALPGYVTSYQLQTDSKKVKLGCRAER